MTKLEEVINAVETKMSAYLDSAQLEHLNNILYSEFRGMEIKEECTDIVETGMNEDDMKIKMFAASKKATNRSDATVKQYVRAVKLLLAFLNKNISDVTPMDLRFYYGYMREQRGLKPSTMQTQLKYLNSFWEFLVTEDLADTNPVRKVGTVKTEKTIKKPFSSEELEALRTNCKNLRDRAMIEFLYSTGVRVSELVSLDVGDIEMGKQELIVYGKGAKERKTYFSDNAKFYLRRYLDSRNTENLNNCPLFCESIKPYGRLSTSGVRKILKELGERAGVADCHPHRFRRTIATDLLNRGMPIEQVKEFLGHEDLDTTMLYCTVSQDAVKNSHKKYA